MSEQERLARRAEELAAELRIDIERMRRMGEALRKEREDLDRRLAALGY